MTPRPRTRKGTSRPRSQGFTLIESVISLLIVGLLFVASMTALAAARKSQHARGDVERGSALAESLVAEILAQAYEEPIDTPQFGPESESTSDRSDWDDVDDYAGWSQSPPVERDGTPIAGFGGWTRSAAVAWVNPSNLAQTSGAETGAKRIIVTVSRGSLVRAELTAVRSEAR